MQFDRAKLKTVVLYVCSKCEPSELGAVKLHKVLYYADMISYIENGIPLTGATYRKRALGPTCDSLLPVLREMTSSGAIRVQDVEYFGYQKKEYLPLTQPDISRLNSNEVEILDEVIDFVCRSNTAKTISEFSHSTPWELVEFGDVLPYHNALHLIPKQVSQEAFDWALEEAVSVEAERSQKDSLDYPVFADFRNRVLQEGSR